VNKLLGILSFLVSALHFSPNIAAKTIWHWQDEFNENEQKMLKAWVKQTVDGLETYSGPLPFDLHIFFHRKDGSREPVPWAHTERSRIQGVHFHVDTQYSLEAFVEDWTASHELSHLVLPYLGKDMRWFAEGFASYMQYQVMREMGTLSESELQRKLKLRIERADSNYTFPKLTFVESSPYLFAQRKYPVMYWGGSVFFLRVNQRLKQKGTSLQHTLIKFVKCCRTQKHSFDELIRTLDSISDSKIFSAQLAEFNTRKGFPAYEDLF